MATPARGLQQLRDLAADGSLDRVCERHRVRVLTVFGSAARDEPTARDLDVGVVFDGPQGIDHYSALLDELMRLTGAEVDLVRLDGAGPVLRERALVGAVGLFEHEPGDLDRALAAAVAERMDTDWMRRLDLALLAT